MDYSVFQKGVRKCEEKNIIYPGELRVKKQQALNCYDRQLILSNNSLAEPTTRISIYLGLNNSMMVFKCEKNSCMVLEWFHKVKYDQLLELLPDLSIFRAPKSNTNQAELYQLFSSVKYGLMHWRYMYLLMYYYI